MKLYIWRDVLNDNTSGVAFALANSREEALEKVLYEIKDWDKSCSDEIRSQEPKVYEEPFGFVLMGGG